MTVAGASTAMSALATRSLSVLIVLLVLLGAAFHGVLRHPDPHRCRQLLEDGSWLEPLDVNGTRAPFKNWQPRGCKLRQYSKEDIHQCMEHRHMVFSGDSTTRQVFWAMGRLVRSLVLIRMCAPTRLTSRSWTGTRPTNAAARLASTRATTWSLMASACCRSGTPSSRSAKRPSTT